MAEVRALEADAAVGETVLRARVLAGETVEPVVNLIDFSAVASEKV